MFLINPAINQGGKKKDVMAQNNGKVELHINNVNNFNIYLSDPHPKPSSGDEDRLSKTHFEEFFRERSPPRDSAQR